MRSKQAQKSSHQASLSSMKEDLTPLGIIKNRINRLEHALNELEFEQDSAAVLQGIKDSAASVLKFQQPLADVVKKAHIAYSKAGDAKKKLTELRTDLKNFHLNAYTEIASENELRTEKTKEMLKELEVVSTNLYDMEGKLEKCIKSMQSAVEEEFVKLKTDFIKIIEENRKQAVSKIYEKDKLFSSEIDKLKSEVLAVKEKLSERRQKDMKAGMNPDRMEQMASEQVSKIFEAILSGIPLTGLNQDKAKNIKKNLDTIKMECDKFQTNVEQEISNIQGYFEEFMRNYLSFTESQEGKSPQDASENIIRFQKQIEALHKVIKENSNRREKDLDSISSEREERKDQEERITHFRTKTKQLDANIEKKLVHLQSKFGTAIKRIKMGLANPSK